MICEQPDAATVHAHFDRVVDALAEKLITVAEHLEELCADNLDFTAFRIEICHGIRPNNPNNAPTARSAVAQM